MTKDETRKYLIENSTVDEETGCWEWNLGYNGSGYGCAKRNELTGRSSHRLSYCAFIGDIPDGMFVCHHCDNPKCINPKHLFVGTHIDNMHDMARKGRAGGGSVAGILNVWFGRKHTEETKRKIGRANSISQAGSRNSGYGTSWIHNDSLLENKRVKREEIKEYQEDGWIVGRKMSYHGVNNCRVGA